MSVLFCSAQLLSELLFCVLILRPISVLLVLLSEQIEFTKHLSWFLKVLSSISLMISKHLIIDNFNVDVDPRVFLYANLHQYLN